MLGLFQSKDAKLFRSTLDLLDQKCDQGAAMMIACVINFLDHIESSRESGHVIGNPDELSYKMIPAQARLELAFTAKDKNDKVGAFAEAKQAFFAVMKCMEMVVVPLDRAGWYNGWIEGVQKVDEEITRISDDLKRQRAKMT